MIRAKLKENNNSQCASLISFYKSSIAIQDSRNINIKLGNKCNAK